MIPKNISRDDVLNAIAETEEDGIPVDRHSVKWSLKHSGNLYPPKYLISIANRFANREELDSSNFSGGAETNEYLKALGFEIVRSGSKFQKFPLKSHSWKVLSHTVAVKELDKSSFLHHGTGIPSQLKPFFGLEEFTPNNSKDLTLIHRGQEYDARFVMDKELKRIRLFWKADFSALLQNAFPELFNLYSKNEEVHDEPSVMRFRKIENDNSFYQLEFINPSDIESDVQSEIEEEQEPKPEGGIKEFYGKRYERDAANRARAVEIHGMICVVCGFDFEKEYGLRGKGYIEIHHMKPLSSLQRQQIINPATDLVPICSNCHRMIHRKKEDVLTIERLKEIIKTVRSTT